MIHVFEGETADEAWQLAAEKFRQKQDVREQISRGGATKELLHSIFTIQNPRQRWVVNRLPALNPAFAIAEVVWILSGRNDSAFLNYWNQQLPRYAGTGKTYHGAYGFRLKRHFGLDQLERAYKILESNPDGRQVVLQIWDPKSDLPSEDGYPLAPDIPCNVIALLKLRGGKLEWMQVMRSNDLFLGTPYNFIQFTTIQELMAGWLDVEIGSYNHLSDSLHLYEDRFRAISLPSPIEAQPNTDVLKYSKEESDKILGQLNYNIEAVTESNLSETEIILLTERSGLPTPYQNLLLIVMAEAARRRGWTDPMRSFIANCSNPALVQVWSQWVKRFIKR